MSMIKTFRVYLKIYDSPRQTSFGSNADVTTYVQAINVFQAEKMIEAQYNGCAKINFIMEQK
jgi:hypothetical protein